MKADREVAELRARLLVLDRERQELQKRLAELTSASSADTSLCGLKEIAGGAAQVVNTSPVAAKVALFRRLFAGRTDVYPLRWKNVPSQKSGYAPACANEWRRGICGKPQVKCTVCPNQAFIPVSDEMIENHLWGELRSGSRVIPFVAGVYPLLADETCWFLAVDFDGENWARDALAFIGTCRERSVPAALERSRSGQGGRIWIFFSEPVAARDARQLGALLLTAALERRPEVGFDSYDRLFPSQDTLPKGRFGKPDRIASAAAGTRFREQRIRRRQPVSPSRPGNFTQSARGGGSDRKADTPHIPDFKLEICGCDGTVCRKRACRADLREHTADFFQ